MKSKVKTELRAQCLALMALVSSGYMYSACQDNPRAFGRNPLDILADQEASPHKYNAVILIQKSVADQEEGPDRAVGIETIKTSFLDPEYSRLKALKLSKEKVNRLRELSMNTKSSDTMEDAIKMVQEAYSVSPDWYGFMKNVNLYHELFGINYNGIVKKVPGEKE